MWRYPKAPCHRTLTLIVPSLKVLTVDRIPQPCNGIWHDVISSSTRGPSYPAPTCAITAQCHRPASTIDLSADRDRWSHAATSAVPTGSTDPHASHSNLPLLCSDKIPAMADVLWFLIAHCSSETSVRFSLRAYRRHPEPTPTFRDSHHLHPHSSTPTPRLLISPSPPDSPTISP
jgi:hypothetical protein